LWEVSGISLRDLAHLPDAERLTLPDELAPDHFRLGADGDRRGLYANLYPRKTSPTRGHPKEVVPDTDAGDAVGNWAR